MGCFRVFFAGIARRVAMVLASTVLAAACAPTGHGSTERRGAIIGGTVDTGDPAVALILAQDTTGGSVECSGTLIASQFVLTAAHCLAEPLASYQITFGDGFNFNTSQVAGLIEMHQASALHSDPAFDPNNEQNGHDIGLIALDTVSAIVPATYNPQPLDASAVGMSARLVGWGLSSASDPGTSATKRSVTTPVTDLINPGLLSFSSTTQGFCEGDSGGPAFMTIGGREVVAGVSSFGTTTCGNAYATEVGRYASFIRQFLGTDGGVADGGQPNVDAHPPSDAHAGEDAHASVDAHAGEDAHASIDARAKDDAGASSVDGGKAGAGGGGCGCQVGAAPPSLGAPLLVAWVLLWRRRRPR